MGATEDLIEVADIMIRHKRNGLTVAYNAVRALVQECKFGASCFSESLIGSDERLKGVQDAAAAILDEIHKLDEGEEQDDRTRTNGSGNAASTDTAI